MNRRIPGWLVALALLVSTTALVVLTQRDVGIARDETVYYAAGDHYIDWWADLVHGRHALNRESITEHWGQGVVDGRHLGGPQNNSEHPPLMKTLFGLSHRVLHGAFGVGDITAYRAPTALLHGVLIMVVFLWAAAVWGAAEGLIASLLLLAMPRLFFHAGLATFDAPIAALWFATVCAYWKALSSRWWAIGAGVVFGLALATKHNAGLLPLGLIVHAVVVGWRGTRADWRAWWDEVRAPDAGIGGRARATLRLVRRRWWRHEHLALLAMAVVGFATLVALWPWLWFDTIAHVKGWLAFHLHHVNYNYEYLGRNWNHPPFPWHVAIVTTLFTVPVVTLAAGALGVRVLIARWRRTDEPPDERPGLLLVLSAAASVGPFFLGSTPIFGAEKHWAAAMPSLAIAAGVGLVWAGRQLAAWLAERADFFARRRFELERLCIAGVAATAIAAAGVETVHAQPYALSWYNALAGGAPGGADLGMNRQFWGYSARGVLPWLRTQPPGPVYSHDASPAWHWYEWKLHLLPPGFPDAGHEQVGIDHSSYALVVHELHFNRHDYMIWKAYGTVQPAFVLTTDGVPIVSVYRKPAPASPSGRSR